MKFGKRYSNVTVFMAVIHGIVLGVLAIIIVGLFLLGAEGRGAISKIEKEVPVSGQESGKEQGAEEQKGLGKLTLYAKQHGAFTTSAAAATFIAENPSLSTAAIVPAADQYFVWSAVGRTEAEIESILVADTYKKTFSAEPIACEVVQVEQLWQVFNLDEVAKIKNSVLQNDDEKAQALVKQIDAITAFTDDLKVIRLHLLANYAQADGCVKISF